MNKFFLINKKPIFFCRLMSKRTAHLMTQAQLAKNIGVSRQTISAIERKRKAPSLYLAFKLADYFGMDVRELFEFR